VRTFILKQHVQAILFKLSSIFIWTVYLLLAHTMANLSEASAGFSISPSTLAYTITVGGPSQAHGVTLTNTGTSTVTVTWADSINWLVGTSGDTVTMLPGKSATITHTASPAGLSAGTYSGTATITGGGIIKQVVPVTLSVTSASSTTPRIGLAPTSLAFTGSVGGPNQARSITVSNTGSTALSLTWADSLNWLCCIQPGLTQTIQPGHSGVFTLTASMAGLTAGPHSGTATITGGGITQVVPVTVTVTSPTVAGTASLTWKANSEPDLAGYKVYRGTSSGGYTAPDAILPKTTTSYTVTRLQTRTSYFFTITAYDKAGNESLHSTEVSKSIY
jgi:hypothetical protein